MTSKLYFLLIVLFSFTACQEVPTLPSDAGWRLVFRNGPDGATEFGNKNELIEAVRQGYPIRVGWGGKSAKDPNRSVEHIADCQFATIANQKEVFAQITPIVGQQPTLTGDSLSIVFREGAQWVAIFGTNGFSNRMMTNQIEGNSVSGQNERFSATSWYVDYPDKKASEEALPLFSN